MKKIFSLIFGILILGSFLVSAHGEEGTDFYNDHHYGMMSGVYGMWGMGYFGWIFMILIVVLLVLLIWWLIERIQNEKKRRRRR